MALIGVVGSLGATFIARGAEMYRISVARAELADEADVALRRLARDLAGALPNSVRVMPADGGAYLEFVPVLGAGRYRAFASVGAEPGGNDPLDFHASPPDTSFQVLGTPVDVPAGSAIVVYNLGTAQADVYSGNNRRSPTVTGTGLVTVSFAAAGAELSDRLARPSLLRRRHAGELLLRAERPAAAVCRLRLVGEPADTGRRGTVGASASRLAASASGCAFELDAGLANIGSVLIRLALARGGETVTLLQQVNVDATP